jgi:hypothetical protein
MPLPPIPSHTGEIFYSLFDTFNLTTFMKKKYVLFPFQECNSVCVCGPLQSSLAEVLKRLKFCCCLQMRTSFKKYKETIVELQKNVGIEQLADVA